MKYKNTAIKVIDLFSGCGGLNEGLRKLVLKLRFLMIFGSQLEKLLVETIKTQNLF